MNLRPALTVRLFPPLPGFPGPSPGSRRSAPGSRRSRGRAARRRPRPAGVRSAGAAQERDAGGDRPSPPAPPASGAAQPGRRGRPELPPAAYRKYRQHRQVRSPPPYWRPARSSAGRRHPGRPRHFVVLFRLRSALHPERPRCPRPPRSSPLGLPRLKVRCAAPGSSRRARAQLPPPPRLRQEPGPAAALRPAEPQPGPARSCPGAPAGCCHSPGTNPEAATGTPESYF